MKKRGPAKVKTPSGRMVPAKYVAGLSGEQRRKRLAQLDRMHKDGKVVGPLAGDTTPAGKKRKTPKSKHTTAYEKRYGSKNKR
jgi:hypothetical protein